jgi:hypothetical protein
MARIIAAAALIAATALAGCGPSDAEIRNEVREGVLSSCVGAAQGKAAGADWRRLCACVADRLTEGRSGRELSEREPEEAERREAVALCRAQVAPARRVPAR